MRVLYLNHIGQPSGGEIALVRLLEALRGSDVHSHVILGEDGPIRQRFEAAGVDVEVLPLGVGVRDMRKDSVRSPLSGVRRVREVLTYSRTLRRRIDELGIDLVHTNSLKAGVYGGLAAKQARVPLVWHLRDRLSHDYLPGFAILFIRSAIALLATRAVCNSQSTLSTLTHRPFRSLLRRSSAIGSPLPDVFDSSTVSRRTARQESGRVPLKFLMVGRLAPWKGQDIAIGAFSRANLSDCTLSILGSAMFGEDDYADRLRAQQETSPANKRIEFLGFRDDVTDLLRNYDVLVHASISPEPFGQVVVEGLAAGLAVIAANDGGPAEILTDGVDGLLHAPGDAADLARAMRRMYEDGELRESLCKAGVLRALDYAPSTVARQMIDVYRDCLPAGASA